VLQTFLKTLFLIFEATSSPNAKEAHLGALLLKYKNIV